MVNSLLYCSACYCAAKSFKHASHFIPIRVGSQTATLSKVIDVYAEVFDVFVTVYCKSKNKSSKEIEALIVEEATKEGFKPKKASQRAPTYEISVPLLKRDYQINATTLANIEALTKVLFYGFCAYGYTQAVR